MKEIAVVGGTEFTLGFRLAGIKNIVTTTTPKQHVNSFLENKNAGIVIIDTPTLHLLDEDTKEDVVNSINPVFVVVSEEAHQEALRKMIKQSIGVDLLKE
jgi:V/A-type H+/Na+-transporting ATPase subunit F